MCSYCGCQENTHIGRFMAEHEQLINLSGELHRAVAAGDLASRERVCDALAALFAPHTRDEEIGIFAEMKKDPTYAEGIGRLCGEHSELDAKLAAVRASGEIGDYRAFERQLRGHIDAEDNGLFPAANIELDGSAWERIDATMTHHGAGDDHAHGPDHVHGHEHDHGSGHHHAHPPGH